jgi:ribosomal protein S18 acetylase RimI-like enzyme
MSNQFVLRRAVVSDKDGLSALHQKSVRETFIEDLSIPYPEKDLEIYFHKAASLESFEKKILDSKQAIWVVEDQTNCELVAYAAVGPCDVNDIPHPDICSYEDGALYRMYVLRNRQGHGFGRQLMNTVLPWFEENYPSRPIWLNVFSLNVKAQKFYEYYGFTKVGEYDYYIGAWKDREFVMKRHTPTN